MIYFITGSRFKLQEAKVILGEDRVTGLDIDLPEIQEIDAHKIIREKLTEAKKHHHGPLIVEDTSLYFEALNGLPGPLIKWFMKTMGNAGLSELASKLGNNRATAKTIIGHLDESGAISFFEGESNGEIVEARGSSDFGWEPIFIPEGHTRTYAEMKPEEKNAISMRRLAFEKLKEAL